MEMVLLEDLQILVFDDWYKFRDERCKEIAINWCKENNIEFE